MKVTLPMVNSASHRLPVRSSTGVMNADQLADAAPNAGARIEIADLKERIRKLEAIAAGVDL